ncbi:hypothetical protein L1049_010594 [Liquidambar formosana]|uniref:Uncharacterized protein n=1 Tax=Liquidambar formosana TaxID=63359 RepID=A0AAP0R262_LIQFO
MSYRTQTEETSSSISGPKKQDVVAGQWYPLLESQVAIAMLLLVLSGPMKASTYLMGRGHERRKCKA